MAKCIGDLVEKRFGNLVVKEFVGKDKYYNKLWRCECDCKKYGCCSTRAFNVWSYNIMWLQ